MAESANPVSVPMLEALLQAGLPECRVTVETDGYHFTITAVGALFAGLRPVQRQQRVYAVIQHLIADGRLHAVNIRTLTPAEQA